MQGKAEPHTIFLPHKGETVQLRVDLSPQRLFVVGRESPLLPESWENLTSKALDTPIDSAPLEEIFLSGKKVCVITDDWGRPTPASRILPELVERLQRAGVDDHNLCFVTASGMHDPMDGGELRRKLGDPVCDRYQCVSHDAADRDNLCFIGITDLGTPVWVNRWVAEADYRIAVGRVYPHVTQGYEGGYKMIVPGVASFETILRGHSLDYSSHSTYGVVQGNPSREEAESCGRLLGLDFLISYVVDHQSDPVAAFAGSCDGVFRAAVVYGEHHVWGVNVERQYDVTVVAGAGMESPSLQDNPLYYLSMAMAATKEDGTIVALMDDPGQRRPPVVAGVNLDTLSVGELLRFHEKRTWSSTERELQWYTKSIRGAFYERRVTEIRTQKLVFVSEAISGPTLEFYRARQLADINEALRESCAQYPDPSVLIVPDIAETYPLVGYSYS